ncbi:MAG: PfkB family carbohydrate kinase, partial [Flavihumibacter sp.]
QYGKNPVSVMPALVSYCDLVMGNIWSMHSLLGVPVNEDIHTDPSDGKYLDHARSSAAFLFAQFPGVKFAANTFRFDTPGGIRYFASLDEPGRQYVSPVFDVRSVVDKVGSGDCFMAGLILGFCRSWAEGEIIRFAAKAAIGKLQEQGDATSQTIEAILQG